jgi:hypothetical protein
VNRHAYFAHGQVLSQSSSVSGADNGNSEAPNSNHSNYDFFLLAPFCWSKIISEVLIG